MQIIWNKKFILINYKSAAILLLFLDKAYIANFIIMISC